MVLHVIVTLAAGYSVGSEFRRRSMRSWLACAGGNPIVALTGKLAPLFAIFFVIMLTVPLILEGLLQISFKGDVPMMVVAASLLIIAYLALGALFQLLVGDLAHFRENWETNGVPSFNTDRAQTLASLDRAKKIVANTKATVIIQHDARDLDKLPVFPEAAK